MPVVGTRGKLIDSGIQVWNTPENTRLHEITHMDPPNQREYSGEGDAPDRADQDVPSGDVLPPPPRMSNRQK